jgi:hypothetical protein
MRGLLLGRREAEEVPVRPHRVDVVHHRLGAESDVEAARPFVNADGKRGWR